MHAQHASFARALRIVVAALAVLAVVAAAPLSRADTPPPDAPVKLERLPPFDEWCVAPVCAGEPQQTPSRLKLPPVLQPNASEGLIETSVKAALARELEKGMRAALGPAYDEAVADVAEAIAAMTAKGPKLLDDLGGLGAAILRAALVYHVETMVPQDAACLAPRRFDAIYEGLAISVAFAPLQFPKKKGSVPAACAATARATAKIVDEAVLDALVPADVQKRVVDIAKQVAATRTACAELPGASRDALDRLKNAEEAMRAKTVAATAQALKTLKAMPETVFAPPPPSNPVEDACTKAILALRAVDPSQLDALVDQGLAQADLSALTPHLALPSDPRLALVVQIASGHFGEDPMRMLLSQLLDRLLAYAGIPKDTPVLEDVVRQLPSAVVVKEGIPTFDPNVLLRYLASRYGVDEDGHVHLLVIIGLEPTPFVLELNGGVPNVDFSQQKVVADATIGYSTPKLGIVGRGWVDTYTIDDAQTHNDYTHTGGSLEGWWLSGDDTTKLRVELRIAGAFDYYDTTTYPVVDALEHFYDFDSRMGRGSLLAGVRYGSPVDRVSLQLIAGGGAQYEDPDTTRFASGNAFSLNSQANLTGQANGRLLLRVHVVPQIFGVRLRGDSTYFAITREQLRATSANGVLTTTSVVEQQQQLELHGRLFLDAEVASFGGFVPALFGGLDYIGTSGSATTTSVAIPSLGAGIVRTAW